MKKSTKKSIIKWAKQTLPYFLVTVLTLGIVSVGSLDKMKPEASLNLNSFAANNYNVSVDQMSELYVVADISDVLGLSSASDVASNYVVTLTMREAGQTAADKLEKPTITNINSSRGVVERVLAEGESLDTLAAEYGITVDQIRWSNGLKTANVSSGTTLYIPSVSGIVYTVKAGETAASIASKYGSSEVEIIALNDLEVSGVQEGMRILIKGGSLPERERPEYVPPRRNIYTYTYLGNTSTRQDIVVIGYFYNLGGPYYAGQCTQWAWYKRQDLPGGLGNANAWAARAAARGFPVNRTPAAGAVFQTAAGAVGHVGYVEAVNDDGSILVSEMNYGIPYRAIQSTIPASAVGNFNYIHRK